MDIDKFSRIHFSGPVYIDIADVVLVLMLYLNLPSFRTLALNISANKYAI